MWLTVSKAFDKYRVIVMVLLWGLLWFNPSAILVVIWHSAVVVLLPERVVRKVEMFSKHG